MEKKQIGILGEEADQKKRKEKKQIVTVTAAAEGSQST